MDFQLLVVLGALEGIIFSTDNSEALSVLVRSRAVLQYIFVTSTLKMSSENNIVASYVRDNR